MTPTPSPDEINNLINLIQNSGNDQQITLLLLIVFVMVSTVALLLLLAIRYKPNLSIFKKMNGNGSSSEHLSAMDKLIEVLGEYNENFHAMIEEIRLMREQEADRVEMRRKDLADQNALLGELRDKLDHCLETKG